MPILCCAAAAFSCTALNLTEGLEPSTCDGVTETCDDLNDLEPTGDPCQRWACDLETGYCAVLTTDADGDGAPAAGCGETPELEDCDDADAARFPGNTEVCDGIDNDCDDIVDPPPC